MPIEPPDSRAQSPPGQRPCNRNYSRGDRSTGVLSRIARRSDPGIRSEQPFSDIQRTDSLSSSPHLPSQLDPIGKKEKQDPISPISWFLDSSFKSSDPPADLDSPALSQFSRLIHRSTNFSLFLNDLKL
ncbi:hypothetical protein U1Q18_016218 [Sarracenia purpurea var. burkii]